MVVVRTMIRRTAQGIAHERRRGWRIDARRRRPLTGVKELRLEHRRNRLESVLFERNAVVVPAQSVGDRQVGMNSPRILREEFVLVVVEVTIGSGVLRERVAALIVVVLSRVAGEPAKD